MKPKAIPEGWIPVASTDRRPSTRLAHAQHCFEVTQVRESRLAEKMMWAWLFKWAQVKR